MDFEDFSENQDSNLTPVYGKFGRVKDVKFRLKNPLSSVILVMVIIGIISLFILTFSNAKKIISIFILLLVIVGLCVIAYLETKN